MCAYGGSRSTRLQWGRESGGGIRVGGKEGIEERIGHIEKRMTRYGR